jgi:hypothetical protein
MFAPLCSITHIGCNVYLQLVCVLMPLYVLSAAWQEIEQQLAGDGEGRVEPAAVCGQGPVQYAEKTPSTTTKSE